ncbi:hypothetical protein LX32DRAFT_17170 [Colletotrichum zoysiae]|uniref:Uncharacterized protein n=1 Tax=Colletotrichum zoysiae TaxID=1216348 RepID=A0AAD9LZD4_9PEZI|nr:hypothetical protein LX32DRAFT_17170 [Colletotrichum zoysiae]
MDIQSKLPIPSRPSSFPARNPPLIQLGHFCLAPKTRETIQPGQPANPKEQGWREMSEGKRAAREPCSFGRPRCYHTYIHTYFPNIHTYRTIHTQYTSNVGR